MSEKNFKAGAVCWCTSRSGKPAKVSVVKRLDKFRYWVYTPGNRFGFIVNSYRLFRTEQEAQEEQKNGRIGRFL